MTHKIILIKMIYKGFFITKKLKENFKLQYLKCIIKIIPYSEL